MFSSGRITEQTFLTLQSHFSGGATGALIPYVERAYGISYATVSLLFVFTFIGYVIAALGAGTLSRKVGFGHALCISVVVELLGVCELGHTNPQNLCAQIEWLFSRT